MITGLVAWLEGKKTFLCAGLAAVVFLLQLLGVLNQSLAEQLYALLGFGAAVSLRSALSKK